MEPQAHYYENYFKNIVGVTHPNNAEVVNVHVRAHNHSLYVYAYGDKKYILVKK